MKRLCWLQWALGQCPGTRGGAVAPFTSEILPMSATLVGGVPFPQHETALSALVCCCNHCQWHFGYINNYFLDSGGIAFPASRLLPPSLMSTTVYRPCVSLRCEKHASSKAWSGNWKTSQLNKIANLGILCICSNMCCYPESLKPLPDETTSIFTDDGSRSGHFLLLYPALKSGDQAEKHDLFSNSVNIYNLHFLSDGACLFLHFRTCPGKWWLLSSRRGKRALFSYCSLITPALLEAVSKSKKDS